MLVWWSTYLGMLQVWYVSTGSAEVRLSSSGLIVGCARPLALPRINGVWPGSKMINRLNRDIAQESADVVVHEEVGREAQVEVESRPYVSSVETFSLDYLVAVRNVWYQLGCLFPSLLRPPSPRVRFQGSPMFLRCRPNASDDRLLPIVIHGRHARFMATSP